MVTSALSALVGRCCLGFTLFLAGLLACDCTTVGSSAVPGTIRGRRENFRLWLDVQAAVITVICIVCEVVRDWPRGWGGWVNRRCAKVYGLNTDHESGQSRVVAWRACVYCCSSSSTNERTTCDAIAIDYGTTGPIPSASWALVPPGEQSAMVWPDRVVIFPTWSITVVSVLTVCDTGWSAFRSTNPNNANPDTNYTAQHWTDIYWTAEWSGITPERGWFCPPCGATHYPRYVLWIIIVWINLVNKTGFPWKEYLQVARTWVLWTARAGKVE